MKLKTIVKKALHIIKILLLLLKKVIFIPVNIFCKHFGPGIVHYMASTGEGTKKCLDMGCLPVLAHYYQPIPDLKDLERRGVWDKVSQLSGIVWNPPKYLENLCELSKYADECEWPNEPIGGGMEFYLNNSNFSYGCASILHCLIRQKKPAKIIEIGSGNSSRIISAALKKNIIEDNTYNPQYTIIDPYSIIETAKYPEGTKLLKQQVETVSISIFQNLSANDILFIDSSHICKIGSDVNFEILEVLPVLNNGVYIHFHDIDLPYEYSKVYATNPKFRMFWTESYLLQAFMCFNHHFEIFLPMRYVQQNYKDDFRKLFKKGNNAALWGSGSFWLKCLKANSGDT